MSEPGTRRGPVRACARAAGGLVLVLLLVALGGIAGAPLAAAAEPNPPWPAACPQRVVLVLDLSSSTEPYLPDIKQAASDMVDALRGAPNEVAVIGFGTSATVSVPLLDAGDQAQRDRLKDLVDDIALPPGDGGGTNWEEALRTAASLRPDVVLFVTDGEPTAHGGASTGYEGFGDSLAPAVAAADALRGAGTRVVGVGMGLQPSSVSNLVQVTGPVAGDDYYETGTDASGLLDRLYDVAGKTCGIPVAALPQPEGGNLPVLPIVAGVVAAALLAALGGYLLSRRSHVAQATAPRTPPPRIAEKVVRTVDAPARSAPPGDGIGDTGRDPDPEPAPPDPPEPLPPVRRGARISRDRLNRITRAPDDPA